LEPNYTIARTHLNLAQLKSAIGANLFSYLRRDSSVIVGEMGVAVMQDSIFRNTLLIARVLRLSLEAIHLIA